MSKKIPKIVYGVPVVILITIILALFLEDPNTDTSSASNSLNLENGMSTDDSSMLSSHTLYSGPFAVLRGTYGVDDTVFLIGSEIPLDSKGEIVFLKPDGEIHHKHFFDGSESAVNHYFTPVSSSDLEECPDCEFFGTWEISFVSNQGISYAPIFFEVEK